MTLLHGPATPPALLRELHATLDSGLQHLGDGLGVPWRAPLAIVVIADRTRTGGPPRLHGDVAGGPTIRLRFTDLPADLPAPLVSHTREFVTHELVHLWNGGPAGLFKTDHSRPWLHEGQADWLALVVLAQDGRIDAARVRARLQQAVDGCLASAADQHWVDAGHGRGRVDLHACGLSLHALAWAQLRRDAPALTPLAAWQRHYAVARTLDEASLLAFTESASEANPASRRSPLREVLRPAQPRPFAADLRAGLQELGLVVAADGADGSVRLRLSDDVLQRLGLAGAAEGAR